MSESLNQQAQENPRAGRRLVVATVNNGQPKTEPLHGDREDNPIAGTLLALDRRLEAIRKEQLAKNHSSLRQLDSQQLQAVEWVTANITRKIFREVADELEHSASEGNGKRLSETVWLMLGLA